MPGKENVLVVVDPSRGMHPALERAIVNAQIREETEQSSLVILVMADTDSLRDDVGVFQAGDWLRSITSQAKEAGLNYRLELCWSCASADAMKAAVDKFQIDMVMLPFYGSSGNAVLSDEKWQFLRRSNTPVLLVRPGSDPSRRTILATIKMQDESYQALNRQVIARGKWAAERYNAQLHVVNSYNDSMNYPDRSAITRLADVPNEHIHIQQGSPDEVIPKLAAKLAADTILIGMKRRTGLKGALRGNTIEKIIDDIPQDIMMLV